MDPWLVEEGIKVVLAYKNEQNKQRVAKVWRFFTWTLESYTQKDLLEYFPEIAARHLTLKLSYHDSFVGMISIDTDKDLQVAS